MKLFAQRHAAPQFVGEVQKQAITTLSRPAATGPVRRLRTVASIAVVPGGAHPSYTSGYYGRDNASYLAWDEIAADRDRFLEWMDRNVINSTPAEFASRVAGLRAAA